MHIRVEKTLIRGHPHPAASGEGAASGDSPLLEGSNAVLEARAEGRAREEEQMGEGERRSIKLTDVILCSLEHCKLKRIPKLCPGDDVDGQGGTVLTALKWKREQRERAGWLCQLCAVRGRASRPFAPTCQGQSLHPRMPLSTDQQIPFPGPGG